MQTIIWAFGSSLVSMLIISFLPLGFTLKGKFFVVLAGFVLALGGLAATTSFPFLAILLMLLVLAFFVAYMMDSRIGAMVYIGRDAVEEVITEDIESPSLGSNQWETETSELEVIGPQLNKSEVEYNLEASVSSKEAKDTVLGLDEDISFLQERNIEVDVESLIVDSKVDDSYLSDIESMILEDSAKNPISEKNWLDELTVTMENNEIEKIKVDDNQIDDSDLELLFDLNEAAAGHEENLPVNKLKPVVNLQK